MNMIQDDHCQWFLSVTTILLPWGIFFESFIFLWRIPIAIHPTGVSCVKIYPRVSWQSSKGNIKEGDVK